MNVTKQDIESTLTESDNAIEYLKHRAKLYDEMSFTHLFLQSCIEGTKRAIKTVKEIQTIKGGENVD